MRQMLPSPPMKGVSARIERWIAFLRPSAQISCRRGRSGFRLRGRDTSRTVATQKLLDCLGRNRSGIQVSLSQFAANIFEHVRLRLCFYAFRNDLQAETVGEHDNDTNDFVSFGVRVHARDMVVILIETTELLGFLGAVQLSADIAVLRTVVGLNAQATIGPQLPLATEPVRGLDQRDQAGCSNRTNARNLAQQFRCLMFPEEWLTQKQVSEQVCL
jgi:hypothetical protein